MIGKKYINLRGYENRKCKFKKIRKSRETKKKRKIES